MVHNPLQLASPIKLSITLLKQTIIKYIGNMHVHTAPHTATPLILHILNHRISRTHNTNFKSNFHTTLLILTLRWTLVSLRSTKQKLPQAPIQPCTRGSDRSHAPGPKFRGLEHQQIAPKGDLCGSGSYNETLINPIITAESFDTAEMTEREFLRKL